MEVWEDVGGRKCEREKEGGPEEVDGCAVSEAARVEASLWEARTRWNKGVRVGGGLWEQEKSVGSKKWVGVRKVGEHAVVVAVGGRRLGGRSVVWKKWVELWLVKLVGWDEVLGRKRAGWKKRFKVLLQSVDSQFCRQKRGRYKTRAGLVVAACSAGGRKRKIRRFGRGIRWLR